MAIDQSNESKKFIEDNKAQIDSQFSLLKTISECFVKNTAIHKYEKSFCDQLIDLLKKNELGVFASLLRSNYFKEHDLFDNTRYWIIIDSINAFFDSIGSYWPYMTQESRMDRLVHSSEHLNEFTKNTW